MAHRLTMNANGFRALGREQLFLFKCHAELFNSHHQQQQLWCWWYENAKYYAENTVKMGVCFCFC